MSKILQFILLGALLVTTFGCGGKSFFGFGGQDRSLYAGPVYPSTSNVAVSFQPGQVPKTCRVFAEAMVQLPPKISGKDVARTILSEAGKRGADRVLIGQSRQSDDNGTRFLYYGPDKEYPCSEQCGSWRFGYDLWEKQGEWVSIGSQEWGKTEARFETPQIMQIVLLRCR